MRVLLICSVGTMVLGMKTTVPVRFEEHLVGGGYTYSFGIAAADLDADGDVDITSADALPNNDLYWYENDGQGRFRRRFVQRDDPERLERHAIGDVDGDGRPDIVIVKNLVGDLLWFQNPGAFQKDTLWKRYVITGRTIPGAYDVALADYDGDGDLDVAASTWRLSNNFVWFENDGSPERGEWKMRIVEDGLKETRMLRAADMDGDGDPDLVGTARESPLVVWYENRGQPAETGWAKHVIDNQSPQPIHGQIVDIDRDGDPDVLMCFGMGFSGHPRFEQVTWLENDGTPGDGLWKKHMIHRGFNGAFEAVAADVDGDRDLDVVATAWNGDGQVVWYENSGDPRGTWVQHVLKDKWRRANQVLAVDLNQDGKPDVVAGAERGSNEVRWWKNLGAAPR